MQHFGVPTRLLDWTENPFIALFFALISAKHVQGTYSVDAAIWVLNPTLWNRFVLSHIQYDADILSLGHTSLDPYKPSMTEIADLQLIPGNPVVMYGTHNSPRIVAQRGAFTIFGKDLNPMEANYVQQGFPQDTLVKLTVSAGHIGDLLKSVISIGITDSVIFPDLEGLARETKRSFGFEV